MENSKRIDQQINVPFRRYMGMGSIAIRCWFGVIFLLKLCTKKRSPIITAIRPSGSLGFSLTEDTIKKDVSIIGILLKPQGIFTGVEQHPSSAKSLTGISSLWAIGISSLQQRGWLMHFLTVPAVSETRLIPNIPTKRQTTIFLLNEFIFEKTRFKTSILI